MNKVFIRCLFAAIILALVTMAAIPVIDGGQTVWAQDAADTPTPEPPTPVTPTPTPSDPTQIPEPITVILFGSGLAALSASVARKRKNK